MIYIVKSDNPYESEVARIMERIKKQPAKIIPKDNYKIVPIVDRKNWPSCEFCCGHENGRKALTFDQYGDCVTIENYEHTATIESDSMEFEIKYCPKCGKPLTEAAWEELEKKVCGE